MGFIVSFSIQKTEFDKIQMRLGRPIADEGGTLQSYQAIGEAELRDLRLLAKGSSIDATNYLLYRLGGKDGLTNASSYISRVIKGETSPEEWMANFYRAA